MQPALGGPIPSTLPRESCAWAVRVWSHRKNCLSLAFASHVNKYSCYINWYYVNKMLYLTNILNVTITRLNGQCFIKYSYYLLKMVSQVLFPSIVYTQIFYAFD